jgi:hypothetical protein
MLYIAFVTLREGRDRADLIEKSRKWWNEGGRPPGLKTVAGYGSIGAAPNVLVFETDDHEDLRKQVHFWDDFEFEVYPALELLELWKQQGMEVM